MFKRKICVVTGSRADYGLLYWLIHDLVAHVAFELQLVVTGMHLSPEFGSTVDVIEADNFPIAARVETLLSSDSAIGVTKAVGLGILSFAEVFERLHPDLVMVLGDRFEIFAAVQAAMFARLPIAHIGGGDVTEGAVDDVPIHRTPLPRPDHGPEPLEEHESPLTITDLLMSLADLVDELRR